MASAKEFRMKLSSEDIKSILGTMGVSPVRENDREIVYPTVCHNISGGSPKLYYYKNEKIFKCYTECQSQFDIFDLIIKMKKLRDENISLTEAIKLTGIDADVKTDRESYKEVEYLNKLNKNSEFSDILFGPEKEGMEKEFLDIEILKEYPYNKDAVKSWLDEGITEKAMRRFNIGYDKIHNAITIPNFNKDGKLLGIRGRFLNPDMPKYMPIKRGPNQILSFPTGKHFYGYYENKEYIKKAGIVILFEGEKSVLKTEEFFDGYNISLATTGKKITFDHLVLLLDLEVKEIILAYDKDYTTAKEQKEKIAQYKKILSVVEPYFNTSIIVDQNNKLKLKDSPADRGKEIFEELLRNRVRN
jgi:hypothetical protein